MAIDLVSGNFLGSTQGGLPDPPPAPEPWKRTLEALAALEESYKLALKKRDAQSAAYYAEQIRLLKQVPSPDLVQAAQASQRIEAAKGRAPRKGEPEKLQRELAALEKQAAKLQAEKSRELKKLEAGPDAAAFDEIARLDRELGQCSYRQQAIQAALQSFERFRKDEASRKRQEAEWARQKKHEAEIRRKAKELHAMIEALGKDWTELVEKLQEITQLAIQIEGSPFADRISLSTVSGLLHKATNGAVSFSERPKGITVSSTLPWPKERK